MLSTLARPFRRPPAQTAFSPRVSLGACSPRVSVVIATYNRAASLPFALAGLARQDYPQFEVVAVPGPCTDDTLAVLAGFPGIRVIPCPEARVGAARNLGAAAAAGGILAFIDDDAVPRDSDWLSRLVAPYADPAVGAVGGHVWDPAAGRIQWQLCLCSREGHPTLDNTGPAAAYQGAGADPFVYLAGCNMSFRRDAIIAAGGFDDALMSSHDDVDICRAVIDAGHRIVVLPEALVDHHYATNASRDSAGQVRDPYRLIHSHAVFVSHTSPDRAAPVVQALVEDWRGRADMMLQAGLLPPDALPWFHSRLAEAARDGLAAGALPRQRAAFGPTDPAAFRAYGSGRGG